MIAVVMLFCGVIALYLLNEGRCRIDEEWCGTFIGRRYCSTHRVRWDGGGPCPEGR